MQCAPHELAACSFPAWYPAFEHLTFRSELLPLPPGFADFLIRDGVFVRSGTSALPRRGVAAAQDGDDEGAYRDWQEDEDSPPASPAGSPSGEDPTARFAAFLAEMDAAIARLGGTVLPKLNWSAPKDAVWLKPSRDIACKTADAVLLLLQSSDRIAHDICDALPACCSASSAGQPTAQLPPPQPTLVLRQWRTLTPGREFRCFVAAGELAGVSQREVTEHFPALAAQEDDLAEAILAFHEEHMQSSGFALSDYAYDVYVTPRGTVRLVDINSVGGTTSPLLFDWAELPYGHRMPAAAANGLGVDRPVPEASAAGHHALASKQRDGAAEPAANGHAGSSVSSAAERLAALGCNGNAGGLNGARTAGGQQSDARSSVRSSPQGQLANGVGVITAAETARGAHNDAALPLDFRIVTEPVGIQPASALYGVPYDLVDQSAGSALAELMRLTK